MPTQQQTEETPAASQVTFWRMMLVACMVITALVTLQAITNKKDIAKLKSTVFSVQKKAGVPPVVSTPKK